MTPERLASLPGPSCRTHFLFNRRSDCRGQKIPKERFLVTVTKNLGRLPEKIIHAFK
jgi:hypothetical protein